MLYNRIEDLLRHFQLIRFYVQGEALIKLERPILYFHCNRYRMHYGFYREKKLKIGSGAIENLQQRLKRSGQRWSKPGAQQISQLRVAKKSNHWQKTINVAQFGKIAA